MSISKISPFYSRKSSSKWIRKRLNYLKKSEEAEVVNKPSKPIPFKIGPKKESSINKTPLLEPVSEPQKLVNQQESSPKPSQISPTSPKVEIPKSVLGSSKKPTAPKVEQPKIYKQLNNDEIQTNKFKKPKPKKEDKLQILEIPRYFWAGYSDEQNDKYTDSKLSLPKGTTKKIREDRENKVYNPSDKNGPIGWTRDGYPLYINKNYAGDKRFLYLAVPYDYTIRPKHETEESLEQKEKDAEELSKNDTTIKGLLEAIKNGDDEVKIILRDYLLDQGIITK